MYGHLLILLAFRDLLIDLSSIFARENEGNDEIDRFDDCAYTEL